MTLDELESSWSTIAPPALPGGISGKQALGLPPERPVYLAVDSQRRRHLLVQIPDGTVPIVQRETRSLDVATSRFQVGTNPESLYVDLICTDSTQHHTFSAIAQDIIRTIRQTPAPPRDSILNALDRSLLGDW